MTAIVATHKSKSLAGRPAGNVSRGERTVSRMTISPAAVSPDGRTDGAPTPFYDHLMSMIHATALENRRVPHNDDVDAAPPLANHRWRLPYIIVCTACLIAAGGAFFGPGVSLRDPLVVAADSPPEAASRVVGTAATTEEAVERSLPAPEPGGLTPIGAGVKTTADAGTGAATAMPAGSDERLAATPVAEKPIDDLGSGVETRDDGPANARASTEATRTDPIAPATNRAGERPLPADAPPSLPPETETGSIVDQAVAPAANHVARIVSGVNMRAGPSNGQAVIATIPRGSPVEVISCRQWCEVIFAGRRGWVYKRFIGASPIPGGR